MSEQFPQPGDKALKIKPKIDMMRRVLVQTSLVSNMGRSIRHPRSGVDLAFVLDI
jgi:hypothetical protein